jgi:hypothetical protein
VPLLPQHAAVEGEVLLLLRHHRAGQLAFQLPDQGSRDGAQPALTLVRRLALAPAPDRPPRAHLLAVAAAQGHATGIGQLPAAPDDFVVELGVVGQVMLLSCTVGSTTTVGSLACSPCSRADTDRVNATPCSPMRRRR